MAKTKKITGDETAQILNSFQDFSQNLMPFNNTGGPINELSSTDTLYFNLRWYLISNYRQLLSEIYVEHGLVQTLVDQPVDDGFRGGFEVKTSQLDGNDIEKLNIFMERNGVTYAIKQALKWSRLFGGGAVLIINDEDPTTEFDIDNVTPDMPLEFRAVDLWELYSYQQNVDGEITVGGAMGADNSEFFDYYGHKLHHTRVYRIQGKEPPSFIRPRLRGWGMSEIEKVVRSLNQYMRNQDVVFALLNEAKVDVYRLEDFNSTLLSNGGTQAVTKRVQFANMIKSYISALVMDKNDEYEQKQINFSGLAEVLTQIRQGIAADLKMPITKLFGISAAGFSSGEDDIENYNAMIEGEIREKSKFIVLDMMEIVCRKLFGFSPDDLMIEFKPLRILSAKEEEEVKDMQFNRTLSTFQNGLATAQEAKEAINKDSLVGVEVDETSEALMPSGTASLPPTSDKKVED